MRMLQLSLFLLAASCGGEYVLEPYEHEPGLSVTTSTVVDVEPAPCADCPRYEDVDLCLQRCLP